MGDKNQMGERRYHGKTWLSALALVVIGVIVVVALVRDRIINNPQWQVTVSGQGRVSYTPDVATINLGVQVDKAKDAAGALRALNERMTKVLAAVKGAGIPDADIQTQSYTLYAQYDYINNISVLAGYNANQQLAVKVRNLDKQSDLVARVISVASAAGANQVNGVNFEASNIEELKQQARLKAIEDARSKAGSLAGAAGVRLGKIVGWWENIISVPGQVGPYYGDKGGMGGGSVTPVVPSGSPEVVVEVGVNYRIK